MEQPVTWKELVADALRNAGGKASLQDITASLKNNPLRPQSATWPATIRRVVRQYRIFEPVKMESGLAGYRLVEQQQLPKKPVVDKSDPHGEQQGLLLQLGVLCGYETFTNSTDKTIRQIGGESISNFATVRNDANSLSALPLKKMQNTDVMWMAEDSEGLFPRYAFEVENSTGVKSGLIRLLRIPERFGAKLYIVGPGDKEAGLFNSFMAESPFRDHASRFQFFFYDEVKEFHRNGTAFDQRRKHWRIEFGKR
jgi:hypothetical protein